MVVSLWTEATSSRGGATSSPRTEPGNQRIHLASRKRTVDRRPHCAGVEDIESHRPRTILPSLTLYVRGRGGGGLAEGWRVME